MAPIASQLGLSIQGWTHREGEGVGMLTQLLHQPLLQVTQSFSVLLLRWVDLDRANKQFFPEGEAQDVQVLAAVAEGAGQSHKHWMEGKPSI